MSTELHEFQPEEVMAYLDGEVKGPRALVLADHLENCPTCSSLADDFRALSQQLIAWTFQPAALPEPSLPVDPEIQAQHDPQMVCAEFPEGLPPSYKEPRKSSHAHSFVRRPWVWASAGTGALVLVVILSVQSFQMSRVALSRSEWNQARVGEAVLQYEREQGRGEPAMGMFANVPLGAGTRSELASRVDEEHEDLKGTAGGQISSPVGMIERTASLSLIVKELETARAALEKIAKQHEGYFAELNTSGQSNAARTLTASMRVPASELDSTLDELRKLGQLDQEKQGGEEVSQQYLDLKARLENSRHTEKRLSELLTRRADKLKDVLDVERELASTREEIERMESEQQGMLHKVRYASIELKLREEYKPALNLAPPSAGIRMRNALVDGYQTVVENALGLVVLLLQDGPSILFWLALVFFPGRWIWRKLRPIIAQKQPLAGAV